MSSPDVTQSYLQELQYLLYTYPGIGGPADPNVFSGVILSGITLDSSPSTAENEINNYLAAIASGHYTDSRSSASAFLDNWRHDWGTHDASYDYATDPTTSNFYNGMLGYFTQAMALSSLSNPGGTLGDWTPLASLLNEDPANPLTSNEFIQQAFNQTFTAFLQSYSFPSTPSPGSTLFDDFVNAFVNFYTVRSSVSTDTRTSTGEKITSYLSLYTQFVPGATQAGFEAAITDFYKKEIAKNGYFLPSEDLGDWISEIKTLQEQAPKGSSLDGNNSFKTQIIFQLLALIEEMVGTIQSVAASQGNRLTFYANAQKAYTDLIDKIPTITRAQIQPHVNDSESNINSLTTEISSINNAYAENLRSYRSVLSDEAKQQQTVVNQSSEAANQQADLFTSLLQEMSTILQSIFR